MYFDTGDSQNSIYDPKDDESKEEPDRSTDRMVEGMQDVGLGAIVSVRAKACICAQQEARSTVLLEAPNRSRQPPKPPPWQRAESCALRQRNASEVWGEAAPLASLQSP